MATRRSNDVSVGVFQAHATCGKLCAMIGSEPTYLDTPHACVTPYWLGYIYIAYMYTFMKSEGLDSVHGVGIENVLEAIEVTLYRFC